jgi:hypothetical protein
MTLCRKEPRRTDNDPSRTKCAEEEEEEAEEEVLALGKEGGTTIAAPESLEGTSEGACAPPPCASLCEPRTFRARPTQTRATPTTWPHRSLWPRTTKERKAVHAGVELYSTTKTPPPVTRSPAYSSAPLIRSTTTVFRIRQRCSREARSNASVLSHVARGTRIPVRDMPTTLARSGRRRMRRPMAPRMRSASTTVVCSMPVPT